MKTPERNWRSYCSLRFHQFLQKLKRNKNRTAMSTVEVEDKLSENDYNMNKIDYLYNLI